MSRFMNFKNKRTVPFWWEIYKGLSSAIWLPTFFSKSQLNTSSAAHRDYTYISLKEPDAQNEQSILALEAASEGPP